MKNDRTEIHFEADELAKDAKIYIVIHGMRKYLWRAWLCGLVFRLVQWIIPVDIILMEEMDGRLVCPENYGCGFTEPYGFVPECGCPLHDPDEYDDNEVDECSDEPDEQAEPTPDDVWRNKWFGTAIHTVAGHPEKKENDDQTD